MITKELIDRYLKNECSEDERRQVSEYLRSHPEELEEHFPEEEFAGADATPWEEQRSEEALQAIRKKLFGRPAVIRRWRPALAAASVILVIGMIWFFGKGKDTPGSENSQHNVMTPPPLADIWEKRTNSTGSTQTLMLTDGSTVDLAPGSEIEYKKVFDKERLIRLEGEALFTIAKDKARPFIVSSGDLSTTVLGTSFSVRSFAADPTIKVHLFTGKVAVRARIKKDSAIGLLPGDELIYNKQLMTARVSSPKRNMAISTGRKEDRRSQPEWYMFGGQPLPQVFDQLSEYYGVEINYYPSDVSNRYFTGKFSKSDSLETILKDISLLHDLSLKKSDGVYIFRKNKH